MKEPKSLVPEGTVFYSCEVCQAKFVNKSSVTKHMRWHNQALGKYFQVFEEDLSNVFTLLG